MARQFFVGGNFKMNGSKASIKQIVDTLNGAELAPNVEIVIAPPAPYLGQTVAENTQPTISVGAQNCYLKDSGAYTGEISPAMIKDVGGKWVILGHSERRALFGETSQFIAEKTKFAVENGVKVILCCGESKDEREQNKTFDVVTGQLKPVIDILKPEQWKDVVVAYEPVWAIGTGLTATPADAQQVHDELRQYLGNQVSKEVADSTRILYGGSVNAKTAPELSKQSDIDGFLVGGASLKPEFIQCINAGAN